MPAVLLLREGAMIPCAHHNTPKYRRDQVITAHIDRQKNKTIDGVTFTNTHSGQKKAYGDSYYEYEITSDLPADEVERVCREKIYKAIPKSEWLEDYRKPGCTMDNAFRSHYEFRTRGEGRYFYQVCNLYKGTRDPTPGTRTAMSKQRIVELQKSLRIARTALERIQCGHRNPEGLAGQALEEIWKLEPKQPLQYLVGHDRKPQP